MGVLMFFWASSVVFSYLTTLKISFDFFKDLADEGIKIRRDRLKEIANEINPENQKMLFLEMIIPIYNIWKAKQIYETYKERKNQIYDQLSVMNAVEEMTPFEKEEYDKKPTGLNALMVPIKYEQRLQNAMKCEVTEGEYTGEIYYDIDNKNDEVVILKTTGVASKMSKEELLQIVALSYTNMLNDMITKLQELETMLREEGYDSTLDLSNKVKKFFDEKDYEVKEIIVEEKPTIDTYIDTRSEITYESDQNYIDESPSLKFKRRRDK